MFSWKDPQAGIPEQGSISFFNSLNGRIVKSRSIVHETDWIPISMQI